MIPAKEAATTSVPLVAATAGPVSAGYTAGAIAADGAPAGAASAPAEALPAGLVEGDRVLITASSESAIVVGPAVRNALRAVAVSVRLDDGSVQDQRVAALGLASGATETAPAGNTLTGDFRVKFDVLTSTGEGSFVLRVHKDWAPIGAARFKELVEAKFYDDTRFYRVIPDTRTGLVQFGLNSEPRVSMQWRGKPVQDDPFGVQSNLTGLVSFAHSQRPNSRTCQLFINCMDNSEFDGQGFVPFAEVEGDGMDLVRTVFDCREKPNQVNIMNSGNAYLDESFPQLSQIRQAQVIEDLSLPSLTEEDEEAGEEEQVA